MRILSLVLVVWPALALAQFEPLPLAQYKFEYHDLPDGAGHFGQTAVAATNGSSHLLFVNDGFTTATVLEQPGTSLPTYRPIACPDGSPAYPQGMNRFAVSVGSCFLQGQPQSFIYTPGASSPLTLVAVPRAGSTYLQDINDRGDTTGYYQDALGVVHGLIRQGTSVRTVDGPGMVGTWLMAINHSRILVGQGMTPDGHVHGVMGPATALALFDIPGATDTYLLDITDAGHLLALVVLPDGSVLWLLIQDGHQYVITAPLPGLLFADATTLTNTGIIAGRVVLDNRQDPQFPALTRGFLAIPTPPGLIPPFVPPTEQTAEASVSLPVSSLQVRHGVQDLCDEPLRTPVRLQAWCGH